MFSFVGGIPEWRKFNYPMFVSKEYQKIRVKKLAPQKFKKFIEDKHPYILIITDLGEGTTS